VQVRTDQKKTGANGLSTLLVARDAPGLTVGERSGPFGKNGANGASVTRWHHGTGSAIAFKDCRVPVDRLLGKEGMSPFASGEEAARIEPVMAAVNLGVGRAAYEAAVEVREDPPAGRAQHHRAPGDRHQARRLRHQAGAGAHDDLEGGVGAGSSPRRSPIAACPILPLSTDRPDLHRRSGQRRDAALRGVLRRDGRHA
jgi:hypothetical protein